MLPNEVPTVSVPPPEEAAEPADTSPLEPEQRTTAHFPAAEPSNDSRHADWPTVAGHEITGEIAKGGMGIVFAARDTTLNREVAIKTLLPELAERSHLAWQFDRESRITAQLPHPGVPPVHASGTLPDGRPFLVMKLIRGHTLDAELRVVDRVANLPRLLSIFEQICQTVGYAHSVGIIHRDLKPLNVMVGAFGEVQVMDWGLARELRNAEPGMRNEDTEQDTSAATQRGVSDESDATWAGSAKGTPTFMPPEQARGEWDRVDARADVFALGGILCVLLTGKPVYTGQDLRAIIQKARAGDLAEAFSRLDACRADADLVSLCKRCLSENPADRPANGKALADAVAAYRAGVEERARNAETERAEVAVRVEEERKRRKVQRWLFASVGLLLVAGIGSAWWADRQANQRKLDQERAEGVLKAEQATFDTERKFKTEQARERAVNLLRFAEDARKEYRYRAAEDALKDASELTEKFDLDIVAEVRQAKTDRAFVVDLDAIRMKRSIWVPSGGGRGQFAESGVPGEYRAAFLARGLDVIADPDAVSARVKTSAVRADLVTALDDWLILEADAAVWDKLLAVLQKADPDSGAAPFRDPDVWKDKAKLRALAVKADASKMSPGAVVAVADRMARQGLFAAPLLRQAMSLYPHDFQIAFTLGQLLHANNPNDPEALAAYRAARAIRSDCTALLNNLGIVLSSSGDLAGAIVVFKEATRLEPTLAQAHANLGIARQYSGDLPGAVAALKDAARLDPKNAVTQGNLGVALADSQDFPGAIAAYKEAIRLDRNNALAHANLGNALIRSGDLPGGVAAHEEAVRLAPKNAVNHSNLAVGYIQQKSYQKAIASAREAIRLNPYRAASHAVLGTALKESGDVTAGRAAYAEAVRLDRRYEAAFLDMFATPVAPPPREVMP